MFDQARARWSADQVLGFAPDAASQRAALRLAGAESWAETGWAACEDGTDEPGGHPGGRLEDAGVLVWGLARGNAAVPYQAVAATRGPTFRCSCQSRKNPCKHILGLLLAWAAGTIPVSSAPGWAAAWRAQGVAAAPAAGHDGGQPSGGHGDGHDGGQPSGGHGDGHDGGQPSGGQLSEAGGRQVSERALAARATRIAAGLDELDLWLADQMRAGIAGLAGAGYTPWDAAAARLVDAKAAVLAGTVRGLAAVSGDPDRLLTELGLLRLLVCAFRAIDRLPEDLAATVLTRCGLPVSADEVRGRGPRVRDRWQVIGIREEQEDHLLVRRTWMRGETTGMPALVLGFAGPGKALVSELPLGASFDAELGFYPGAQLLRALVVHRHGGLRSDVVPRGVSIDEALRQYAAALARDPWLDRWPMVLDAVVPVSPTGGQSARRWHLAERGGTALPVDLPGVDPWRMIGAAGGRAVVATGEWSPAGFRPMAVWANGRLIKL